MPYITIGMMCIRSPVLARDTIANIIAIMLIMSVIVLVHPFPFKRPPETMKLAIANPTNTTPPM